ncbi:MAG TPA: acetylxylan esterase, partial [Abditibacteriaceae bacterium]
VYTIEASAILPSAGRRVISRQIFTYAPETIRNATLRTPEEREAFSPLMDAFWATQLAGVQNRPRISDPAPKLDLSKSNYLVKVYKVSFTAVEGERINGWLAIPAFGSKFPGVVELPYFSNGPIMPPTWLARMGFAALAINVHGEEVDATTYPSEEETYVGSITTPNITNPQTFVYRRMMSASLGAVDYLAQHPNVDATRLGAIGFSQGGGLAVNVAALDPRIKAVVANSPAVDFPRMLATATMNPMRWFSDDLEMRDAQAPQVLHKTLSYFEPALLAERLRVPLLVTTTTNDRTTPPSTAYALRNAVPKDLPVRLLIEVSSEHTVTSHQAYASLDWLRKYLQSTEGSP